MRKLFISLSTLIFLLLISVGSALATEKGAATMELNAQVKHKGVAGIPTKDKKKVANFPIMIIRISS